MVNVEVSVDQTVSHRNDRPPWDRRGAGPRLGADFRGRFTEDFDGSNQREAQHHIGVEIAAPPADDEALRRFGGLDHMVDADDVVRPHIEFRPSAKPPHGNGGSSPRPCANPPFVHSRATIIPIQSQIFPTVRASLAARIRRGGPRRYRTSPHPSALSRKAPIAGCDAAGTGKPRPLGRGTKSGASIPTFGKIFRPNIFTACDAPDKANRGGGSYGPPAALDFCPPNGDGKG